MNHPTPIKPDITLDLTGTSCPGPILGTKKMITELSPGQVLLLLSDCPGTRDDLMAWAEHTGNAVIRTDRVSDTVTGYYVQRGRDLGREPSAQVVLDMRGSVCPGPIIEARKMLNGMPVGATMKLISNCSGSRADVTDWARVTGIELLSVRDLGPHEWAFFLRRNA